ncbi:MULTISPECIES: ABC transporter ATP-binding protein [unclassified Streptococcus]|uniref:ABC transporter ATP-binding protein n=1 Tax=unclassified Streptococcus TaxID=2608887 RepID=UPI001071D401|nr:MULTISPECIES: ABC transporter ATP-binding protein [unclassified Streptococcus]MBF0788096.1 ABC transporter ATP-binding protein [Streptococcus sp. 19428wC2_LYSM12]MCQ9212586.1 ABC transporter ATP-binding protein/permease [Streptococcus sp. B01]MCQ9213925.1 ABC transporter ATP-binding protein/permease [Streptococcus sp. O1]TFV04855.1 ABC transporter ATP-binding protein [Streptococcus sp. LYSM12]
MKRFRKYGRGYLKEAILAPLLKLMEACFELAVPLILAFIVDTIIPHSNHSQLIAMILLLVLFATVGVIVALIAQYYSAKVAVGYTKELTQDLYKKIVSLLKSCRNDLSSDSLLTRLTNDTLQIQTGINIFLRLFLRAPIVVFGSLVMAFYINPSLSLNFLGMIALLFLIVSVVSIMASKIYLLMRKTLDSLVGQVRESMAGIRVIRSFGQSMQEIKAFQQVNQTYTHQQLTAGFWASLLTPVTFLVVNITLLILIYQGRLAIGQGRLDQGMLIALINYLSQILVELVKMVMVISSLNQSFISAGRLNEIFEQESEDIESLFDHSNFSEKWTLVVKNLSFAYTDTAENTLTNLSFRVRRGEFLGIIGGTGAGKSTLVDLLLQLYPVDPSHLALFKADGHSPVNLREWREQFALVGQQAQLFSGTVRSNLLLGKQSASDETLWWTLEIAQAKEFVLEKGGLEANVESFGRNFSGGQRQRLTIARALLQEAPILILDDATSALDYLTERNLRTAIQQALPDKLLIMISQRTNSLLQADQILVLDQGQQVGLGCHEELLQTCAIYQEIDQSQHGQEVLHET